MDEDLQAVEARALAQVLDHMNAFTDTILMRCAIELELPDIIHRLSNQNHQPSTEGVTLSQLAGELPRQPVNTGNLRRILRYLVHMGLLTDHPSPTGDKRYRLTPASKLFLLSSDVHGNKNTRCIVPYILMMTSESAMSSWHGMATAPFTKTSVWEEKHGAALWEVMTRQPEMITMYNEAIAAHARLLAPAVMTALHGMLDGARSLVDVGGGTGIAASQIAEAFPHVKCMVLELPHVVKAAAPAVAGAVELIGGDMFECVPGADAVMLMRVLHDWDDEKCLKILEQCKKAIPKEGGKVILVEMVLDDEENHNMLGQWKLRIDLAMMVLNGGKERSLKEWNVILQNAGLYMHKITPAALGQSVIEACPL